MTHTATHIGLLVVFGIVLLPVYLMFLGWFIGKPRNYRPVGLALGYMLGFVLLVIVGMAALGMAVSIVIGV